jgi:glycosyltransferase involved in cell wall biosynthesis
MKKALIVCFVWPEPESSAAGVRTSQLIHSLRSAGWQVHATSPCQDNEYRARLQDSGVQTAFFAPNDSGFDGYVRALDPDLVLLDRFMTEEQFGWRVRAACPRAVRVLDTSDLHSLRRERQKTVEKKAADKPADEGGPMPSAMSEDALRELGAIYRSDLSLVVSDFEQGYLSEVCGVPAELVSLCRFSYSKVEPGPGFQARRHFVAIGNFRHPPNLDSFRWLHRELWPAIRARVPESERANTELHIYGAYPPKELMALDDARTGFRVKGRASDARETLSRYRVNLAPLRFGAGIKGKVSDGWSVGTPCVGTAIAAEGMTGGLPFGGAVVDAKNIEVVTAFAEAAVRLYDDPATWEQARSDGLRVMGEAFAPARNEEALVPSLDERIARLELTRARNVIGQILWHHTNRSTEYFSRWIEAKNRPHPSGDQSSDPSSNSAK